MKIFNKRPIVLFAIFMVAFVLLLVYHNSFALRVCLFTGGLVLLISGIVLYFLIKKPNCKFIFSRIFIVGLASIISLLGVVTSESIYNRDYIDYSGYATVSGTIIEVGDVYSGNKRKVVLNNVNVVTSNFQKDLYAYTSLVVLCDGNTDNLFVVGANMVCNAKISFSTLYYVGDYGLTFSHKLNNITCSGYTVQQDVVVVADKLDLSVKEKVKQKAKELIEYSLDEEYVGLALGMLFGDRSLLVEDLSFDFSASGVAHLLAVSGLHVGFLVAILMFICKLFKVKGLLKFILVSICLIFYAYLCGFSASVVRAVIMSMCMLYAGCRLKRYDSLNALSIAVIINLIINPFSIASIGFRLSYMAVLSIILLAKPIAKLFSKFLTDKLANTFGTMLAVQVGISGVFVTAFKNISVVTVIANFVSIPLASLAYMILFITLGISFIMPFAKIIIFLYQFVMQWVVKFVHLLAQVNTLVISSWQGSVFTWLSIPTMVVSSNYLFANKKLKAIICSVLWVAMFVILFV